MTIKQEDKESLADFVKRFRNARDIMEAQHGKLPFDQYVQSMITAEPSLAAQKDDLKDEAYDRFVAYAFIQAVNQTKAGKLEEDLTNAYALGYNKFPAELSQAINSVINYRNQINNPNHPMNKKSKNNGHGQKGQPNRGNNTRTGANFAQAKGKGRKIVCFNCWGNHFLTSPECPENKNKTGTTNAQVVETTTNNSTNDSKNNTPETRVSGWTNLQLHSYVTSYTMVSTEKVTKSVHSSVCNHA